MPNVDFNAYNIVTLNCVMTTPKFQPLLNITSLQQLKEINHNNPVNNIGHSNDIGTK